jgi:4-amino-4-deoxy-L-arabinose transferase-like glycosyltransferase
MRVALDHASSVANDESSSEARKGNGTQSLAFGVSAGGTAQRLGRRALGMLFAFAFVLRLAHVLAMTDSPYFNNPIIDAQEYERIGAAIARGAGHPENVFWHPPAYPYFLGAVWAVSRGSYLAPRLMQALFGAFVVVLTAWIGARTFRQRVGLVAGMGAALCGTLLYYDAELLAASVGVFFVMASVALALLAAEHGRRLLWTAAGLVGGLGALTVASSIVVPLIVAVFARRRSVWVVLGLALALAPATLHNRRQGGEWVLISSNGGVNLSIGNNPNYEQMVSVRPDKNWLRLVQEPEQFGIYSPAAKSSYFVRKAVSWAVHEPAAFARLQLHKMKLLVSGDEIFRNQAIYPARQYSPILRALLWKIPGLAFPFGVLMPLAAVGLWLGARQAPLLVALVGGLAATVLMFFVTSRYRVPLLPFLLIFAAYAAIWSIEKATNKQRVVAVLAAATVFLLSNVGLGAMDRKMNADAEYALAMRLGERGNMQQAMALFESAVASRPDYAEAWLNLSACYESFGKATDARAAVAKAYRLDAPFTVAALRDFSRTGKPELAQRLARYLREAVGGSVIGI